MWAFEPAPHECIIGYKNSITHQQLNRFSSDGHRALSEAPRIGIQSFLITRTPMVPKNRMLARQMCQHEGNLSVEMEHWESAWGLC